MAKEILPAWQQVLLVALNGVPHRENGHDAWMKLNEEEQSAVMDFLTEHCGENAQAALEEACGKIKRPKWWTWFWAIFSIVVMLVVGLLLLDWWESLTDVRLTPFLWFGLLCPMNMHTAWKGNPAGAALEIWEKHVDTRYGTTLALNDMYRAYTTPRKERMNKAGFVFWLVMLVLWGTMAAGEIMEHRGPSVPQQIVSVLEDAAEGKASLTDAEALLEGWSVLRQKEHVASAWDRTAKWSDERYLAAALVVRLGLESAPDYAREALLTTRLGSIDTQAESAEFAAMLALCDAETVRAVRERVDAVEFPEKTAVLAAFE